MDILPTFLDITATNYPDSINGLKTIPIEGRSILPLINGEANATRDTLFWEHETGKALRIGDWKISALIGGEWELFNLAKDRTESNNLSLIMPDKVKEMEAIWVKEYKRIFKIDLK